MKKLERWRWPARDGLPAKTPASTEQDSGTVGDPSEATRDDDAVDDTLKALRQAAMPQHEDTVPAAFYRTPGD